MKQVIGGLIILLAPIAVLLSGGDEDPDHRAAADALTLHYLDAQLYDPVACELGTQGGTRLVYCHPSRTSGFGGLWAVTGSGPDLAVHPLNGKAMQHADGRRSLGRADNTRLAIAPWQGERLSVAEALAVFE